MPRCLLCALALLAVAVLGGCDTDNPSSPLEEVQGVYAFTELRFDPSQPQVLEDVIVHERLVQSNTSIEIFGAGPALIRFQLEGGPTVRADAVATATRSTVRLTAETEQDAARLAQILLPPTITLSRSTDGDRLSGDFMTTANLQAYDPELYGGLVAQPGTLTITLDRATSRGD
ncbi:MAG: hypothetical protein R3181_14625 [Rubricoccaceae bacterium]|nr:hypothetical protein [Rubricoccaceae bacterium]